MVEEVLAPGGLITLGIGVVGLLVSVGLIVWGCKRDIKAPWQFPVGTFLIVVSFVTALLGGLYSADMGLYRYNISGTVETIIDDTISIEGVDRAIITNNDLIEVGDELYLGSCTLGSSKFTCNDVEALNG